MTKLGQGVEVRAHFQNNIPTLIQCLFFVKLHYFRDQTLPNKNNPNPDLTDASHAMDKLGKHGDDDDGVENWWWWWRQRVDDDNVIDFSYLSNYRVLFEELGHLDNWHFSRATHQILNK